MKENVEYSNVFVGHFLPTVCILRNISFLVVFSGAIYLQAKYYA